MIGQKLRPFVNLRYFWETGVHSSVERQTFVPTLNFPIPSILLE